MAGDGRNGGGALGAQAQRAGGGVVRVAAQGVLDEGVDAAPCGPVQLRVRSAVVALRQPVLQGDGFAVQPVGRPVGGDVAAVAPYGAQLLAAGGEPGLLAPFDLVARPDDVALLVEDLSGDRRGLQVDLPAHEQQRAEGEYADDRQPGP